MTMRRCTTCRYALLPATSAECDGCLGTEDHPKWLPESNDAADLRDEFAKAALPALIARAETLDRWSLAQAWSIANYAYIIANAMLKARGE